MHKPTVIIVTILAFMVVAYIAMAVNYKKKSGPVIIVTKPSNICPANSIITNKLFSPK